MARKPTRKEAKDKLATLPNFKKPTKVTALPPPLRPIATIPYVFDQGGKAIARLLIHADPLNRIDNSRENRILAGELTADEIINDPNIVMDEIGNIIELIEPLRDAGGFELPSKKTVKMFQKTAKEFTVPVNPNRSEAEYMQLRDLAARTRNQTLENQLAMESGTRAIDFENKKKKRKPSAYNKRYAAAFKKVAPQFKKKSGGWKKDGFKRAGAAARKIAKK